MSDINNSYTQISVGSPDLELSVAGAEVLYSSLALATRIDANQSVRIINFELINDQTCHISLNGGDYVYYRANQGLKFGVVSSCKILENGITYNWSADFD